MGTYNTNRLCNKYRQGKINRRLKKKLSKLILKKPELKRVYLKGLILKNYEELIVKNYIRLF